MDPHLRKSHWALHTKQFRDVQGLGSLNPQRKRRSRTQRVIWVSMLVWGRAYNKPSFAEGFSHCPTPGPSWLTININPKHPHTSLYTSTDPIPTKSAVALAQESSFSPCLPVFGATSKWQGCPQPCPGASAFVLGCRVEVVGAFLCLTYVLTYINTLIYGSLLRLLLLVWECIPPPMYPLKVALYGHIVCHKPRTSEASLSSIRRCSLQLCFPGAPTS